MKIYVLLEDAVDAKAVPPERLVEHCAKRLARFYLPRYVSYVDSFPYTPSDEVTKHVLVKDASDLIAGSFDCVTRTWR